MKVLRLVIPPEPTRPDDPSEQALAAAAMVAEWTRDRLTREVGAAVDDVAPPTRVTLEHLLSALPTDGFIAFCHGSETALHGHRCAPDRDREIVLDSDNAHLLAARWVWAFACRTGVELAGHASAKGARCYAGYQPPVILEWTPSGLDAMPDAIRDRFQALVTETPLLLAQGVTHQEVIRRRLFELSEDVIFWCDNHPGIAPGVEILAQQLYRGLVVRPP